MNDVLKGIRPTRQSTMDYCPDDIWATIESCWAHKPQDRPMIDVVVKALKSCSAPGKDGPVSLSLSSYDDADASMDDDPAEDLEQLRSWINQEMQAGCI